MKTYLVTHPGLVKAENQDRFLIKELHDGSVLLAEADGISDCTPVRQQLAFDAIPLGQRRSSPSAAQEIEEHEIFSSPKDPQVH